MTCVLISYYIVTVYIFVFFKFKLNNKIKYTLYYRFILCIIDYTYTHGYL